MTMNLTIQYDDSLLIAFVNFEIVISDFNFLSHEPVVLYLANFLSRTKSALGLNTHESK